MKSASSKTLDTLQEIGVHVPAAWPRVASFRARRFRVWRFCGCRGGGLKHIVPRKFLESQKSMKNVSEARKNTMENVTSLAGMQLLKSHVFYQLGSLAASSVRTVSPVPLLSCPLHRDFGGPSRNDPFVHLHFRTQAIAVFVVP